MSEKLSRRSARALISGAMPKLEPSRKQAAERPLFLTSARAAAKPSEESFFPSGVRTQNQAPLGSFSRMSWPSRASP